MAGLVRSPKSGNEWTNADIRAYNITFETQDFGTFFGQPVPMLPPSELLTLQNSDDATTPDAYRILRYMLLAMDRIPNEESWVAPFTEKLLVHLGYESLEKSVMPLQQMPFFTCGESRIAAADVCVMSAAEVLLVAQEDKQHMDDGDPDPQLVAEAIAAFQFNNYKRTKVLDEPAIAFRVIAGLTMVGTAPTFFKIPVTQELVTAVELGEYPAAPTVVAMHVPKIARPSCRVAEGMQPLDNRQIILACFEAFKQFV
ncbi:hypothetical protein FIBSPDRAFT_855719 [Athelia psychrophila]|uniref:Uncharacterized protein n=1 Tax=Athelia psychrophila TaxID=1759441 RepID=A0A167TTL5_9AGAM|nr:hypothetical protein FIBSPDRAFT_879595 [Fibularhizoctonia sp. CBS 109695]KZP25533.1 hypothetical protein FIBSPDRAFT_855719 [Fibularhizoctonia sp. CBS 109695]